jgi:hypothetical protein
MVAKGKHAYLVHPKEWVLWILLFCCVLTVRVVLYSAVPLFYVRQPFQHFEGIYYPSEVYSLLDYYCEREAETFCEGGRWNYDETCTTDVWGLPFGAILGMNERSTPDSQALNCSVLAHIDVAQEDMTLVERERKAAVEKMTTIFLTLLNRVVHSGREKLNSPEPFALPWQSIGTVYILRLYCLFVYDDNPMNGWKVPGKVSAWNTVIMSNSSLWTEAAFVDLLTQAIEKTRTELSTKLNETNLYDGHYRERGLGYKADPQKHATDLLAHMETLKNVLKEHIEPVSVAVCPLLPGPLSSGANTKTSHTLFAPQQLNDCMLTYYGKQHLPVFSPRCKEIMEEAPAKLDELEMEAHGGFLIVSKLTFLGVSVACFLVLSFLLNTRRRLEKRLERRRQQLQQELNDPFLRNSLQHRPGSISEEERTTLISRLEAKVTRWDSKSRALDLSRQSIRRFRWLLIFTMTATTLVYLFFHIFHVSSMPAYLNTIAILTAMLTVSYCAPTEDGGGVFGSQSIEERLELVDIGVDQLATEPHMENVIT